jgi:hypothetical protein
MTTESVISTRRLLMASSLSSSREHETEQNSAVTVDSSSNNIQMMTLGKIYDHTVTWLRSGGALQQFSQVVDIGCDRIAE